MPLDNHARLEANSVRIPEEYRNARLTNEKVIEEHFIWGFLKPLVNADDFKHFIGDLHGTVLAVALDGYQNWLIAWIIASKLRRKMLDFPSHKVILHIHPLTKAT